MPNWEQIDSRESSVQRELQELLVLCTSVPGPPVAFGRSLLTFLEDSFAFADSAEQTLALLH